MKICHVIINFEGGGAQSLLRHLALIQFEKSDVSIIVIDKNSTDFEIQMISQINKNGIKTFILGRRRDSFISVIRTLFIGIKLIRKIKPDIINSHLEMAHFYAAIFKWASFNSKLKHVATIHNSPEIWNKLYKFFNRNTALIYCSDTSKNTSNFKNKISTVIENGISFKFEKKEMQNIREFLCLTNEKLVISLGSVRYQKNYKLLVDIAKHYTGTDVHFLVCGANGTYGPENEDIKIFQNTLNLHYLGLRNDTQNLITQCDCFLSCSFYEGLPIAVLEAFYAGIPCVLSPIQPHVDIVDNMDKCYIPSNFEVMSFANELDKALAVNQNKNTILANRKKYLENYSIEQTNRKYYEFYESLI